jgi:tetratricopeptide (TPR) repeat protein
MKSAFVGALAAMALATAAQANPIDDGNAGLTALQNGDNDQAIALFTRALASGGLKGDDREFAYANRGKAYLNKFDISDAIADLDRARQMKPDDVDAQTNLISAISQTLPATLLPGQSAKSLFGQFGAAVGQAVVKGVAQGLAQSGQPQN